MPETTDPFFRWSNYIEAGFWILVGLALGGAALRRRGNLRWRGAAAALTLCVFGGSDVVEASTGAWWRPWWLLLWKALCIAVLVVLLADHWRRERARRPEPQR